MATQSTVLVTGASGTVGRELVLALRRLDIPVREALTHGDTATDGDQCRFAFEDSRTWASAVEGVDRVFLMRPSAISDVKGVIRPFIEHLALQPTRSVVVLSLMGVNPAMPHWRLERDVKASGLPWTMLRPAFFMQNLQTAYRDEIRDHDRIRLPAGGGRTSFIDTRDIADVTALALMQPAIHAGKSYTLTGGQALSWAEVAAALSSELDRPIRYEPIGLLRARSDLRAAGLPRSYVNVQLLINIVARAGLAARITDDLPRLLHRPPRSLADYLQDHHQQWAKHVT